MSSTSFLPPLPHSSRSIICQPTPAYRHVHFTESRINPSPLRSPSLHLELGASPIDEFYLPIGAPLVVLVALILAFSAQSWINSLLGGDQGLGAFLSDGAGFNKSGFKPRRRAITDERAVPGDVSGPLGGPDPLPWLKLPQFDFVDVAGQPKKSKSGNRDESDVIAKLEFLRGVMKMEIEQGNLEGAKRIENELEKLMKEEGFNYSP